MKFLLKIIIWITVIFGIPFIGYYLTIFNLREAIITGIATIVGAVLSKIITPKIIAFFKSK